MSATQIVLNKLRPRRLSAFGMLVLLLVSGIVAFPSAQPALGKKGGGNAGDGAGPLPPVRFDFELLDTLGGQYIRSYDMNAAGEIVGDSSVSGTTSRIGFPDTVDERRAFVNKVVDGQRVTIDLYELLRRKTRRSGFA